MIREKTERVMRRVNGKITKALTMGYFVISF